MIFRTHESQPVFTVEPGPGDFKLHQGLSKKEALEKTVEMLKLVNTCSPRSVWPISP